MKNLGTNVSFIEVSEGPNVAPVRGLRNTRTLNNEVRGERERKRGQQSLRGGQTMEAGMAPWLRGSVASSIWRFWSGRVRFQDRVSLHNSPGCPGTHSIDETGLELGDPPTSAGIKGVSTMSSVLKQIHYKSNCSPWTNLTMG